MICVDASVLAACFLPDEAANSDETARIEADDILVPALCRIELMSIIAVNERRGRITLQESALALAWVIDLNAQFDDSANLGDLLDLSRRHKLTAYDAAYLELALRRNLALLTHDKALAAAARAEGVAP